jgi:predicted small secreted protein
MRGTLTRILGVIVLAGFLSSCETLKGVKADIENTPKYVDKTYNHLKKADDWLQEHYW